MIIVHGFRLPRHILLHESKSHPHGHAQHGNQRLALAVNEMGDGDIQYQVHGSVTREFVKSEGFVLYYTFKHYLIAGSFALIAALAASYLPARKAAAVNPVDIIRGGV